MPLGLFAFAEVGQVFKREPFDADAGFVADWLTGMGWVFLGMVDRLRYKGSFL